jgi:ABC-type transport system substrate-binding protein
VEAAASRFGSSNFRPNVAELFYAFNLKSPKFADPRFREAIVRAVDREAIVNGVYQDTVRQLDGVVVNGVPGHTDDPCGDRCQHDPTKAKALLAQAFPAGKPVPEVALDFDDDATQQKVAEAIQANLKEVGIPATLRRKPLPEYEEFVAQDDKELFRLGWIAPYPSADAFLAPLFGTGSVLNLSHFSTPAVDNAINAARAEANASKRVSDYQAAEKAVMAQVPLIPIAQFLVHSVVSSRAHGLVLSATGTIDTTSVTVTGS